MQAKGLMPQLSAGTPQRKGSRGPRPTGGCAWRRRRSGSSPCSRSLRSRLHDVPRKKTAKGPAAANPVGWLGGDSRPRTQKRQRTHHRAPNHARPDAAPTKYSGTARPAEAPRPDLPAFDEADDQKTPRRHVRKGVQLCGVQKKPKARLREGRLWSKTPRAI
jgi:hypothetical protein